MLETKHDSTVYDHPSKTFTGVRFVLLGFNPINAQKVRSQLVNGGGVDVFQYGPNCTHVIVDKLSYDDPICVAAQTDGKVLVTGLWVDHSFDIGMPVDPTSVLYTPLRDLEGIPGAKSLIVCLTGYQRQDRDDIMTMVGLMGAIFSKPLVANKVTHLICYKFEGEKYELAKKMKKIKLVNHRWLEDCLRAWEILPEANYDKSGYELEMMEAEAKDSEEEDAQDIAKKQYGGSKDSVSPHNLHIGKERAHPSPLSKEDISRNLLATSASKGLSSACNNNDTVLATAEETVTGQALNLQGMRQKIPDVLCSGDTRTLGVVTCGEPSEQPLKPYDRTPPSAKRGNALASTSGIAKRSPHSDAATLTLGSYSRKTPRRNTLSLFSGEKSSNVGSIPKVAINKLNTSDGFDNFLSRAEQAKDGTDTGFVKTPSKNTKLHHERDKSDMLPEKRKMNGSCGSSKAQKTSHNPKARITGSPLVNQRTGCSEQEILINLALDENAISGPQYNSPGNIVVTNDSNFDRQSLPKPFMNAITSKSRPEDNVEALRTSFIDLNDTCLSSEPNVNDGMNTAKNAVNEFGMPQRELQDVCVPSPEIGSLEIEKSYGPCLGLLKGNNADSLSKPLGKKAIAKKSLGTRPRLGPGNTKNKKGSIYMNETPLQSDDVTSSIGGKETADTEMFVTSEKVEMIPSTVNIDKAMVMESNNVEKSHNEVESKIGSMDDETEAPEEKEEHEFETGDREEKPEDVDPTHEMNIVVKGRLEAAQPAVTIKADANSLSTHDPVKTSEEDELEKEVHGRKDKPNKSVTNADGGIEKSTKLKKRPLNKTLRKPVPSVAGRSKSKEVVNGEESKSKQNNEEIGKEKEKSIPSCTGKTKRNVSLNMLKNSMEVEKENRPVGIGDQNVSHGEQQVGKVTSKLKKTPTRISQKASFTGQDSAPAERVPKVKVESLCFILSGHKLQRKEFQQLIRRLKGKVCRDSHQWSYQATHFIVPDPIRRTEKFFAAAASGRWILKTDYLTASYQEGRFLTEEPYEWHKNGLSEDGAINLEAPRKWRLLRERTGHGAFYGMRIIIYGECIAPPLDTLKRVIRAGDGTLLATSPPYTRFLESGVDFAIVSPGMPRVDIWVQEFLRHEIPCVVADYLVEYVCKPGYSLERHVQYNTHAWAERSFANLQRRSEEVVVEYTTPEDCVNNDLSCQVCGSRDRGEVMLICGEESGSTGCGVGTHIDCCNPPLEQVPDEDWFCPNCSDRRNSTNRPKSTKQKTPLSKGK
ncbi:BRCT domain-containing protein [Actinidia chinensis var. chinensis]|uniref:BRCT domain-containing protein n=1 Tax=Actinidia chinensis var. chinensis TaxID=1590841 RepID=A0A2R6QUD3_ACTCC|nr:BRCT domain-containing protein [Actinidia chinensis var. chinensis]